MSDGVVIGNLQIPVIKGEKGDTGEAGKIISLQVVMLASTATAYANNTGTQTNAEIVLGIPRGVDISSTNINQNGELIITLDNDTSLNAGQVVGKGISNVSVNEEWDFVVTLTDGSTIIVGNLENEIKGIIEEYLEDYYTKDETYTKQEIQNLNNLVNYTLKSSTGSSVDLSIDNTTYIMTLQLKDIDGNVISTDTVDLPLETMVVNASYDKNTKEIVLTLQSGSTVSFSVADLVSGLVSETTFNTIVENLRTSINSKQNAITNENKLNSDLVDDTNSTNKFTNATEKSEWNAKYTKPASGIPKTDLDSDVQASLEKADTAVQDVSGKEDKSNKTGTIDENSTNTQYPNAKAVYNELVKRDEDISEVKNEVEKHSNTLYTKEIIEAENSLELEETNENLDLKVVEIESDKLEQKSYEGYNKLNIPNTEITLVKSINRVVYVRQFNNEVLILQAGTYTIVFSELVMSNFNDNTGFRVQLHGLNEGNFLTNGARTFTITEEITIDYLYLFIVNTENDNATVKFSKIMIYEGTEEKPYEPYTGGAPAPNPNYPIEVEGISGDVTGRVRTENLWEFSSLSLPQGVLNEDGSLTITSGAYENNVSSKEYTGLLQAGNYIFENISGLSCFIILSKGDYSNQVGIGKRFVFNYDGISYLRFVYVNQSANTTIKYKAQLLKGDIAKDYIVPKSQPIPLSLGTKTLYRGDKIVYRSSKWQFEYVYQNLLFDGSSDENWRIDSNRYFRCYTIDSKRDFYTNWKNNTPVSNCYSNIGTVNYSVLDDSTGFGLAFGYGVRVNLKNIDATNGGTVEQLREYLSENPIRTVVQLAEPEYEDITDPTLLSQLNSLLLLKQYNDTTYIEFDQDVSFEVEIERERLVVNEKFDNLDSRVTLLENITKVTDLTWKQVQAIVQSGRAQEYFNIGDQLITKWKDTVTNTEYDVPLDVASFEDVTILDENEQEQTVPRNDTAMALLFTIWSTIHSKSSILLL